MRAILQELQAISASLQAMVNLAALGRTPLQYDPQELAENVRAILRAQDGARPTESMDRKTAPDASPLMSSARNNENDP